MPVSVVVGGQFGSEGKGKVAHFLARERLIPVAVRVGGPNAGHTVVTEDRRFVFRQLPTPSLLPGVTCVLPAGSLIDPEVLLSEISLISLPRSRLIVDPKATIIVSEDKEYESSGGLRSRIGSTLSGTGAALQRRIGRVDVTLAEDIPELRPYTRDAVPFLRKVLAENGRVLIEGSQGFGLSILHSSAYPYVTSRDTTAAGCLAETGLSPTDVDEIYLVIRAFPIRVSGNSGPLPREIDWGTLTHESGSATPIVEYTSVTQTRRRVARFDPGVVRQAIAVNNPSHIVLNHLDYVDVKTHVTGQLTRRTVRSLNCIEVEIGRRVDLIGVSPSLLLRRATPVLEQALAESL